MENEENKKTLNIFDKMDESKHIFKLDFENQSLDNKEFINWKKDMIIKYGKSAKLFKCKKEKILFYAPERLWNSNSFFYNSECPSCANSICYFCSKVTSKEYDIGSCCLKRRILFLIFKAGDLFFLNNDYEQYSKMCRFLLIPFVNSMLLFTSFLHALFFLLDPKNIISNDIVTYQDHFEVKSKIIFVFLIIIMQLFSLMASICFTIIIIYLEIFIIILSIIFKGYPLKYISGIIYNGGGYYF